MMFQSSQAAFSTQSKCAGTAFCWCETRRKVFWVSSFIASVSDKNSFPQLTKPGCHCWLYTMKLMGSSAFSRNGSHAVEGVTVYLKMETRDSSHSFKAIKGRWNWDKCGKFKEEKLGIFCSFSWNFSRCRKILKKWQILFQEQNYSVEVELVHFQSSIWGIETPLEGIFYRCSFFSFSFNSQLETLLSIIWFPRKILLFSQESSQYLWDMQGSFFYCVLIKSKLNTEDTKNADRDCLAACVQT